MRSDKKDFPNKLLTLGDDIQVVKRPLFIIYHPHSFAIKGRHTREIIKIIKPGDIIVRSFKNYLNSFFILGTFTHVGFYLGEVNEAHLKQFAKIEHPAEFNTGKQTVIHAIGDKICLEDLIDFCRCDGLALMRFPRQLKSLAHQPIPEYLQAYFADPTQSTQDQETTPPEQTEQEAKDPKVDSKQQQSTPPPPKLDAAALALIKAEKDIAQYLVQGKGIEFEKVFKILYRLALRELTMPHHYDFGIEHFRLTTCTKFVYFITKSICWNYGIEPQPTRLFFKQRHVITPDAFVDGELEEIWKLAS